MARVKAPITSLRSSRSIWSGRSGFIPKLLGGGHFGGRVGARNQDGFLLARMTFTERSDAMDRGL